MGNNNNKKRKIIRIEDIKRDPNDFLTRTKIAKYEIRAKYANRKVDVPLEDKLRFEAKKRNTCITCNNEATKLVSFNVKGGGALQLERYCASCFDRVVDLDKMVMRHLDNSDLVIIKPSEGGTRFVEEWRLKVKKGAHF